ncbi:MAG TPA: ABC transporter ATP-binding protein [Candidatus Acidoferrales bacterium]|nr:ABC transporter ATP-binding protein [Candidatus Acidoferrales bacterium]
MSLEVAIRASAGAFAVDATFAAVAGQTVAILGPNGAGKTTLIRAIAGLVPASGRVVLDGVALEDSDRGISVPTERRPVGVVFQQYLLFPHLTVLDNVAYGPRARGAGHAQVIAQGWLERLGIAHLATARPATLSGGEAQRVALARALAIEPRLLLLDEPLAALDVATRSLVRRELRSQLAVFGGVRVLVTHDPVDALTLADSVVVLERGTVVQQGAVAEVAQRPRSDFVADLLGINLLRGRAHDGVLDVAGGSAIAITAHDTGEMFATIRPSAIALYRERPEGSPRNVFRGAVSAIECGAERCRVRLRAAVPLVAEVTPAAVAALGLVEGVELWASFKATEIDTYLV